MAEMDESDFADMVEQTPVRTYVIEYREPSTDGRPGRLVGACLTDQQSDGLSMIYSFFDVGPGCAQGARDLHHPRPHRPRRARRAALRLSRLLGRGIAADGVQDRLPAARAPRPRRLAAYRRCGRRVAEEIDLASVPPLARPTSNRRLAVRRKSAPGDHHRAHHAAGEQPRLSRPGAQVDHAVEHGFGERPADLVEPKPRIGKAADQQLQAAEHQPSAEKDNHNSRHGAPSGSEKASPPRRGALQRECSGKADGGSDERSLASAGDVARRAADEQRERVEAEQLAERADE